MYSVESMFNGLLNYCFLRAQSSSAMKQIFTLKGLFNAKTAAFGVLWTHMCLSKNQMQPQLITVWCGFWEWSLIFESESACCCIYGFNSTVPHIIQPLKQLNYCKGHFQAIYCISFELAPILCTLRFDKKKILFNSNLVLIFEHPL